MKILPQPVAFRTQQNLHHVAQTRLNRIENRWKGAIGLAMLVQQGLSENPFDGAIFAFRGRNAGLVKVLWHDGIGLCLLTKRLERGQFIWPSTKANGAVPLSAAQLATLLEGCEWRAPVTARRPALAG